MILRIINKTTNLFVRDDFIFDESSEIGLDVTPSQGLYAPLWDGKTWVESLTDAEIQALKDTVPESVV